MQKLRVGVLMGGKSLEKEVSLNSGRTICDHLDTERYAVIPLFETPHNKLYILPARFLHRGKISDFEDRLATEAQEIMWDDLKKLVDIVYIAQHGRFGEDGCVQGFLEVLQIPYVGSKVFASALGMNKYLSKLFLQSNGINVPRGFYIGAHEDCFMLRQAQHEREESAVAHPGPVEGPNRQTTLHELLTQHNLTFPLVVKPEQEGSSFGVSVVHTMEELVLAIERARTIYPCKPQGVLVEEYITGLEFSCIVITNYKTGALRALPPTEIVAETDYYTYEQKYMPGRALKITPARCSPEQMRLIKENCIKVMQALHMTNLSRIDGFLRDDNSIVITDPNSFAGMAPSSFTFVQAAQEGLSHTALINHLIETELAAHGMLDKILEHERTIMQEKTRKKIGVLLGGRSHEKEVSLDSGRNILYKLSPQKYEGIALFVNKDLQLYNIPHHILVFNSTKEIEQAVTPAMHVPWHTLPQLVDFVFIGLHGGEGENGAVQGTLELLGIPYNGSGVFTSALCMDKYKTNNFLRELGFSVPRGILYTKVEWDAQKLPVIEDKFPVIVKPHDDGCSVMVSKAHNETHLYTILEQFFATEKTVALIEEYVDGMELTVGVIGNREPRALPPSQAVSKADILTIEEKFLPGAGENKTPAPLPLEALKVVQHTIESAYCAIQAKGYARIDCFYQSALQSPTGKERVVILEVNTLPGMTPATCIFHQAAEIGMKPMEFIDHIIELGFEEHGIIPTAQSLLQQETL